MSEPRTVSCGGRVLQRKILEKLVITMDNVLMQKRGFTSISTGFFINKIQNQGLVISSKLKICRFFGIIEQINLRLKQFLRVRDLCSEK